MPEHAIGRLANDEADIQHRPDGEGGAEIGRRVMVVAMMTVVAMSMVVAMPVVVMTMVVAMPVVVMLGGGRAPILVIVSGGVMTVGMVVHVHSQVYSPALP
jgi:hypothetical protein